MNPSDAVTPRVGEGAPAAEGCVGRELVGDEAVSAITRATDLLMARRVRARELREFAADVVNGVHVVFDADWLLRTAQLLDGKTLEQAAKENE